MSRVAPILTSFNGGAVSRRLGARIRQAFHEISLSEMVGFAPFVEGTAEAMPGTIHVSELLGAARLFRFEFNTTQGHVLAFSEGQVEIFTNDELIATIASPYTYAQAKALRVHQSFDVLYCFHPELQPRKFVRTGATTFAFELLELAGGPFELRNNDRTIRVSADALTGAVNLESTEDLFAATDVGGLFRMEAEDFGDVTSWEPYITVTLGQLLTWNERVYRVAGGKADGEGKYRTGSVQPLHTEGVEWDGIGQGLDRNGDQAAGVQLEYLHDRFGVIRLTAFTDAQNVAGTVERRLPFSAVAGAGTGNYTYTGGYYAEIFEEYAPPTGAVTYAYGTHRWSFGSFSDTRGWPRCGAIWEQRLCLAKDSTIYGSVKYDLENFAELNELGEVSADMAFIEEIDDPNSIEHFVPEDTLLALTRGGMWALGPSNAAAGVGPGQTRSIKQNDAGCGDPLPVTINSRTAFVDQSGTRIYETDFSPQRRTEQELDLSRYARFMGNAGWTALAQQQQPFNHIWGARGDGTMTCAAYLPEEEVLGFAERQMAPGLAVRDVVSITDPEGRFQQVWIAAEYGGAWHMLRMAQWRLDGQSDLTGCVLDMAGEYDGEPTDTFSHPVLPSTAIAVVADGVLYRLTTDAEGGFTLPRAHGRAVYGLEFPAWMESLDFEAGGDNGPAMGRKAKWHRTLARVIDARGLAFGPPDALLDMETERANPGEAIPAFTGFLFHEASGDHSRMPRLRIERRAPFQSTIAAWGGELSVEKH
ncbi:MAG: hypothetical protein VKL39_17580 [Leptolyngbyaceae bacterium]|nr:hypothetical protein [Leptolyngbyaceae bacterium]